MEHLLFLLLFPFKIDVCANWLTSGININKFLVVLHGEKLCKFSFVETPSVAKPASIAIIEGRIFMYRVLHH